MTEEQIILNLEEMAGFKSLNLGCKSVLHNAIALINRKKAEMEKALATIDGLISGQETLQKYIAEKDAEIERLQGRNKRLESAFVAECDLSACSRKKEIRDEAIKEFAERLKNGEVYMRITFPNTELGYETYIVLSDEIDNLVKEMVGDE